MYVLNTIESRMKMKVHSSIILKNYWHGKCSIQFVHKILARNSFLRSKIIIIYCFLIFISHSLYL